MNEVTQDQINIARWAIIGSAVMLFLAIPSGIWPYGYYVLLRWVVAGTGVFAAYLAYNVGKTLWAVVFGLVVLLFNPIIPIHLTKDIWVLIDLVVALIFFTALFSIREDKAKKENSV